MRIAAITVFPVKSARGIALSAAHLEPRGLQGDRRWMIADGEGRFVTQRELPDLARLAVGPAAAGLRLGVDGDAIVVALPARDAMRTPVTIWKDALALPEAVEASRWLSRRFGRPLRLFHQPDDARRPVSDWTDRTGDEVSLADGFPVLLATTASLAAVRQAAGADFGMERFRPNLVIDGAPPWAEDGWARLRVGATELDLVKPCARCRIATVDQAHGAFAGEEPLETLRRIRLSGDRRAPGVLPRFRRADRVRAFRPRGFPRLRRHTVHRGGRS